MIIKFHINIINYIVDIINLLYVMIFNKIIKKKLGKITPIIDNDYDEELGTKNFEYCYDIDYNNNIQKYYIKNIIKLKNN